MTTSNLRSVRLLLVEDDLLVQKITLRVLKRLGHEADIANDGLEAIEMSSAKDYDIIFMDLHMPRLDGVKAASAISQSKGPGGCFDEPPVIIVMTADQLGSDFGRYRSVGIADWIAKPVQVETLKQAIAKWAANASTQSSPTSPDLSQVAPSGDSAARPPDLNGERTGPGVPPADLRRIGEMTDGDRASMRELAGKFLGQIKLKIEALEAAVASGNRDEVERLAHFCAGSSAACGMTGLVAPMRELEEIAQRGEMTNAPIALQHGQEALELIRLFLSDLVAS